MMDADKWKEAPSPESGEGENAIEDIVI
jgi:hypothetical protein